MRTKLLLASLALTSIFSTAVAQSDVPAYKRNFVNKSNNFVEKTRDKLNSLDEDLFTSNNKKEEGTIKIKGNYYMPLYSVNLYKKSDSEQLQSACTSLFVKKLPSVKILSVALPQTAWNTEEVVKDKKTVGYLQIMYCYIIGKTSDGNYINARFTYKRYKDVGSSYTHLSEYWPKWERTDFLSQEVYERLLKK